MKKIKITILVGIALVIASCSKTSDPTAAVSLPPYQNVKLSFASTKPIAIPTSIATSTDSVAKELSRSIEIMNEITANIKIFTPPTNATTSSTKIVSTNGRSAGSSYLVYNWTDTDNGNVAYQVSEVGSKYTFEAFVKKQGNWTLAFYAEEQKDTSVGLLDTYDIKGTNPAVKDGSYGWNKLSGGELSFKAIYIKTAGDITVTQVLSVTSRADKSGQLLVFNDEKLEFLAIDVSWDALGNGQWVTYKDKDKNVLKNGSWKI
jgi:hypothetical protein